MNDNREIGRNITRYRRSKKLTQAELAKTIGMSKGYLAAIEEGRERPRIKTLARIAECLDVELEVLLREKY
ncbi:XRE family transcriptional regulator [Desulfosporosinus fructosivorans]|uniref:XRE family transcriptional regulator n=1 Tax=Desulfosporosinus fructosivorans TaxID=2018669 RepID=A0A4Z0QZG3_9FIRM|nr:helix-turn-helix transcriptional regulator [Desulfosporosinus fructosivorans]TGE35840.1 XRE family transcriptional regulator [Desulfosporosinus fructosivorans]